MFVNLVTRTAALGRTVVKKANETEVTFLAASIAYYAFVALIPLLLILFVAATALFGEEVADGLIGLTQGFLTPLGEETVVDTVSNAAGRGGTTLVGVALLFWTGLRVFRGLDIAFSMVYGVRMEPSFLRKLWNATIAFVAVVLAISGILLLGTFVALFPRPPPLMLATPVILFLTLTVVFLPLFYFFPGVPMTVREAAPGSIVAAFGWALLDSFFGLYAANAAQFGIYGVIGGVLLLVTWLYIGAIVLISGAIVNAALSRNEILDKDRTITVHDDLNERDQQVDVMGHLMWCACPDCGEDIHEDLISGGTVDCLHCGAVFEVDFRLIKRDAE
ncbi:YhjD/YihY/BrkB family envelope integrity protein [Haloarculaceae archaeon H-GB1-1]|nr:YhjD/YihY/BrkB family envelope integrity protein [Haloarculaceae archaeon H-GB1-1]